MAMSNLTRRDFLICVSATCGLALLRFASGSKREAISDIQWDWDDCGVYWSARLYIAGRHIGLTGNYYCVDNDGFRPDIRVEEQDMLERYELLDGDTGVKTIGELPMGSVLELPEMDDFVDTLVASNGEMTTTYHAVRMWGGVRIVAPDGEQWRTVNWGGEQGNLWVRC
jgi:hypothetical protein